MGWRRFFRRAWWDVERARELEAYLELETDDNIARGMSPDEARRAARRKLGNPGRIREEIYAMNTVRLLDWLRQDIRYAARVLRRNPGFTVAAVLTLALGIGGVTVIYSALRNILLDPFPYVKSEQMVNVFVTDAETGRHRNGGSLGEDEFLDLLEQQQVFEDVVGSTTSPAAVRITGATEIARVTQMTPNTFAFLGVTPLIGRVFTDADGQPGAAPVVVLEHDAWKERFGGHSRVLGTVVTIDEVAHTVIGVMPQRFGWQATEMWVPVILRRGVRPPHDRPWWYQAHLRPGVTLEQASAHMTTIVQRRALTHPDDYPPRVRVSVLDLRYRVVGHFSVVLYTLLAAVAGLLLIACCNVANMLLARATTREREMTVRAALGGSRVRIMAHLLTEAGLLALGGAVGGCLLAWGGIHAVAAILPSQSIAREVQLRLVPEALMASLGLSVLTTLMVGILPAWHTARRDLVTGMQASGKGTSAGHRHGWVRHGLVVLEVTLSLVLLLGAGLLVRDFIRLIYTDLGIDTSRLAFVAPRFEKPDQPGPAHRQQFYDAALARIRRVSGVGDAALSTNWIGGFPVAVTRTGDGVVTASARAQVSFSDERLLGVVGLAPIRGRGLTASDVADASRVAVISRSLAQRHFADEDPIGQFLQVPDLVNPPFELVETTFRVVGVVEDVRNEGPRLPATPTLYVPTTLFWKGSAPRLIVVRTTGDPASVAPALTQAVRSIDPNVTVLRTRTADEVLQQAFHAQPRFSLAILSTFAVVGLLLVAIGVYGVTAYAVTRRSQEFAIRMALGATRGDVLRTVLTGGAWLLGAGVVFGLAASRLTNRWVAFAIMQTADPDVASSVTAVALILGVGVAACLIPAWRASRTNPMAALRQD